MKPLQISFAAGAAAFVFVAAAQGQPTASTLYRLLPGSTYEEGCHGPCACPVSVFNGMHGTFRLVFVRSDLFFRYYDVRAIDWQASSTVLTRHITGSGTYRIGGDFAYIQDMQLDLRIDGGPVIHVHPASPQVMAPFPRITITENDQIETGCYFHELPLVAAPVCFADLDDGSGTGMPDGGVTIDDLLYYLHLFAAGDLAADLDDGSGIGVPDSGVTIDDLLFFLGRFSGGC